MARIHIVEDDEALRRELAHLLGLQGYEVSCGTDFAHAVADALAADADCIILDLMLPNTDGHAVCRDIRAVSDVQVIVLTSSDSEFDEVMALGLGADDYMQKPYRPAVLMARVQAAIRRASKSHDIPKVCHGGVTLDIGSATVSFEGRSAELTRNELRILSLIMRNPGQVISRSELMRELWESDEFIDDNTLTVNVNRLRRTLEGVGLPYDFLKTRRGQGYSV